MKRGIIARLERLERTDATEPGDLWVVGHADGTRSIGDLHGLTDDQMLKYAEQNGYGVVFIDSVEEMQAYIAEHGDQYRVN